MLERKLLRAYDALYKAEIGSIWHPAQRKAAQVAALGGELAATQVRYAEKRLTEAMPELIQRLTLDQQPQVAEALLYHENPRLADVVALLVKLERNLNYRDDDPRLLIPDDGRLKAAGLGRLSRQQYDARLKWGPPLELTPWAPKPQPVQLRTKKKTGGRRPRALARAQHAVHQQLCFEFPGGGVTLAYL